MKKAIEILDFVKSYDDLTVIKKISFDVFEGEIFALLGANGAGKTTTLECIEGIRKYDSGSIKIMGSIGVQLQSSSLPQNIMPLEAMKLFGKWNDASSVENIIETFNLKEIADKQYKQLSTGQKRRLHLAIALIGNPDIIILDEPTAGLDVESRAVLHDEIRNLKKMGKTIIMASHDMAEVESLCDRIAILKDGIFAFVGTSNELTREIGTQALIHIRCASSFIITELSHSKYEKENQKYSIYSTKNMADALLELLSKAKDNDNTVLDIKIEKATFDSGFIEEKIAPIKAKKASGTI